MNRSSVPDSSSSGSGYGADPERLILDDLPMATGAVAEALERNRPGPMTLAEYAEFVRQFHWTAEQLKAIPTAEGFPRFTLDD